MVQCRRGRAETRCCVCVPRCNPASQTTGCSDGQPTASLSHKLPACSWRQRLISSRSTSSSLSLYTTLPPPLEFIHNLRHPYPYLHRGSCVVVCMNARCKVGDGPFSWIGQKELRFLTCVRCHLRVRRGHQSPSTSSWTRRLFAARAAGGAKTGVSTIFGTMSIPNPLNEGATREALSYFREAGFDEVDTAIMYQGGTSEMTLGELAASIAPGRGHCCRGGRGDGKRA